MIMLWQVELTRIRDGSDYWLSWQYAIDESLGCTRVVTFGTPPEFMAGDLDSSPDVIVPWGWTEWAANRDGYISTEMHMELLLTSTGPVEIRLGGTGVGAPDLGLPEVTTFDDHPGGGELRDYDAALSDIFLLHTLDSGGGSTGGYLDGSFQRLTITEWVDSEPIVPAGYLIRETPNADGLGDGVDVNFA